MLKQFTLKTTRGLTSFTRHTGRVQDGPEISQSSFVIGRPVGAELRTALTQHIRRGAGFSPGTAITDVFLRSPRNLPRERQAATISRSRNFSPHSKTSIQLNSRTSRTLPVSRRRNKSTRNTTPELQLEERHANTQHNVP